MGLCAESPGPIRVEKHGRGPPLAAPVRRIFYLSAEGTMREHEVFPPPNPRLLAQVDSADAIVYGMGFLYTSICPSLVLKVWRFGICACPHQHAHHSAACVQGDSSPHTVKALQLLSDGWCSALKGLLLHCIRANCA